MARKRKIPEPSRNGHKPPVEDPRAGVKKAAQAAGVLLSDAGVAPDTVEAFVEPIAGGDRMELFVRLLDHLPEPKEEGDPCP